MQSSRFLVILFLAGAIGTGGDLSVLTGIRNGTPWGHVLVEGSRAASEGRYAEAAAAFDRAIHLISPTTRADWLELGFSYNGLGASYCKLNRPQDGEPLLKKAVEILEDTIGRRDLLVAVAMNNLAETYTQVGRHEEARYWQMQALAIDEAALGPSAALVANDWNNLGVTYARQRRFSEAERAFQRAVRIASSTPHPRLAEFTGNLAALLTVLNHTVEAQQMQRRVLDMQVKARGRTDPSVGWTLIHLANCEMKLKRYATAVKYAAEAVGILRARLGERHPRTASAYFALAKAYERLKRIDLAQPAIEAVLEIDKQSVIDPAERSAHLREYAVLLRDTGKKDEAKAAEDLAAQIDEVAPDHVMTHQTVDVKELSGKW